MASSGAERVRAPSRRVVAPAGAVRRYRWPRGPGPRPRPGRAGRPARGTRGCPGRRRGPCSGRTAARTGSVCSRS
ncbi:hypothetical protein FJ693_12470 [Georgenia yuyongxinii]|uniref:Uncharacterized protein n=1 Tax=Georgenia yuyongxinii TaxID=2589797 RepID=A0A552WQ33_9MICO|nr:hypothetical protein FJ693_12470 [Georgenia yuyongxinii]